MTKPIWKKVTSLEPGIYLDGGFYEKPYKKPSVTIVHNKQIIHDARWYARICDYVEPEMPLPELEVDTKVQVRDSDDGEWENRHFVRFENGRCLVWSYGETSWTSDGDTTGWLQWRLPEGPK